MTQSVIGPARREARFPLTVEVPAAGANGGEPSQRPGAPPDGKSLATGINPGKLPHLEGWFADDLVKDGRHDYGGNLDRRMPSS